MFLKVLLVSLTSMIGVLLLEQYILLEAPTRAVQCDAGGDPPAPPERDAKRLTLEDARRLEVYRRWMDERSNK